MKKGLIIIYIWLSIIGIFLSRPVLMAQSEDQPNRQEVSRYAAGFLLNQFAHLEESPIAMPHGDNFKVNATSLICLNNVDDKLFNAYTTEDTKRKILFNLLRNPNQYTEVFLLCVDSGKNLTYRFINELNDDFWDITFNVKEIRERLLRVDNISLDYRRNLFTKVLEKMSLALFSDENVLASTYTVCTKHSAIPEEYTISNEDYQAYLLDKITSKAYESIFPAMALYLELDITGIFKYLDNETISFYVPYSQMAEIFHKASGTFDDYEDLDSFLPEPEDVLSFQEDDSDVDSILFQLIETKPQFDEGGISRFSQWILGHLIYPEIAEKNGVQGRVTLQFNVNADGSVSGVKVLRGVDPTLDEEAARIVSMSPKWEPGKQRGRAATVTCTVSVLFTTK